MSIVRHANESNAGCLHNFYASCPAGDNVVFDTHTVATL